MRPRLLETEHLHPGQADLTNSKSFWANQQRHKLEFENLNVWWDKGKLKMKDICWKFLKAQAKVHKTQQKLLENNLSFPSTEDTIKQKSEICEKLGTIHWQQVASVKICSKDCFYNDNEKPINQSREQ